MKKIFTLLLVPLLFTSVVFAQMQLKLSNDFEQQNYSSTIESNSLLILPNTIVSPPDAMELRKGLILLGILADVSIPMGNDFKHIAGTGFSGHVVAGYLLSPQFLISLRAGYVKFGTQTEEGNDAGYSYTFEDKFSQIPILLGANYLFSQGSPFRLYLGLAIGIFIQNYSVKWQESGYGFDYSLDESFNNNSFGIVPALGFYYLLSAVVLQASAEYSLLLSDFSSAEGESTSKASSVSVNFGVSFPVGGK
jgi:hypothetical protein